MDKRLLTVACMASILALAVPVHAQDIEIDVELLRDHYGNSITGEGDFHIDVEGEGVAGIAMQHPSLPAPIVLMQNVAGFDHIEFEREEDWNVLRNLLPNGSYELFVKKGLMIVNYPFIINYALMPPVPTITYPAHEQVLPTPDLTITWDPAPAGVDLIEIEVSSDFSEFSEDVAPTETSLTVPSGVLKPGQSYEVLVEFTTFDLDGMEYASERVIEIFVAAP